MRRLKALFSWPVATPILAYIASALIVVSVVGAFVAAHDATDARNRTAAAASRRIDQLQGQIERLQTRLRNTSTRDARERGRLEDAIQALAEQIRQSGGTPVTTGESESANSNSPTPRPSNSPTPSRSPTPHPSPTPAATCIHIPLHDICLTVGP